MSNLLKSYAVVCQQNEKRLIDSNEAVSNAIEKLKEQMENNKENPQGFIQGLTAENVENLLYAENDTLEGNIIHSIGDDTSGISGLTRDKAEETAKIILDNANGDARAIVEEARSQAVVIIENARKEGYEAGFNEGINNAKETIDAKISELNAKKQSLESEYEQKRKEMEPLLVDTILKVFSKVTHVLSEDKEDLILNLVESVINDNKLSSNFLIRASKEDADFLRNNRDKLINESGKDLNIEIAEDTSMKRSECLVETDMGIFDCSLDIQLKGLIRDIKLLACAVDD